MKESNVKQKLKNGKLKDVNVMRIKRYLEEPTNCLNQDNSGSSQSHNCLLQDTTCPSQDNLNGVPKRPMTSVLQKLIQLKNAAAMAVSFLENEICELCDGNTFREDLDKNLCKKLSQCNALCYPSLVKMKNDKVNETDPT
jgi:hypothetical protein